MLSGWDGTGLVGGIWCIIFSFSSPPKQGKVRYFIKKYPRAIKIKGIFSPINRSHSGWGADVNIAKPDKIRYPKYCKILCKYCKTRIRHFEHQSDLSQSFATFFTAKTGLISSFFYKYVPPMYRLKEVIGQRWLKIIQTFFGNSCPT